MAQQFPLASLPHCVSRLTRSSVRSERTAASAVLFAAVFLLPVLGIAQGPTQQYVYTSTPTAPSASNLNGLQKNAATGTLSTLPTSPFLERSDGGSMAVDALGRFLFVLNPTASTISMFQIDATSGALTEVPDSPFAIGVTLNPSLPPADPESLATEKTAKFLYVGYRNGSIPGQGEIDEFQIDSTNLRLAPTSNFKATISGAIGMAVAPNGRSLYAYLGFTTSTGTLNADLAAYSIDPLTGGLTSISGGGAGADARCLALDPMGRFVFAGHGQLQGEYEGYQISPVDGSLTLSTPVYSLGTNLFPDAMAIEASGQYLYVVTNLGVHIFSIDPILGTLTESASSPQPFHLGPSMVADPVGPFIYSSGGSNGNLRGFQINLITGLLTELPGSPYPGAGLSIAITGAPVQAVSGPVATLSPHSLDFGSQNTGQPSASQIIHLVDTGDQSLSVNSITLAGTNPGDFTATPACSTPTVLQPNATCAITVVFAPAATGLRRAALTITDNAPGSPQTAPLSGTGAVPQPAVTLTPGTLSFPAITQNTTSAPQAVTVTNSGAATLHISSVALSGANPGDFAVATNTCSGATAVNSTCGINVTFTPLAAGSRAASIVVTDDAPDSPQSIPLSGTGSAPPSNLPAVTLTPGSITLAAIAQGGVSAPQSVVLTSSGGATLHISSVVLAGANPADYAMATTCNAASYPVNSSCSINVTFAPLSAGPRTASIVITDDAPNSPQAISVTGTANPAFGISAGPSGSTSATITAGQTAVFSLQLTPGPGFTGSVSFACTGAPANASCMPPASLQVTSGSPIPFTVSVTTSGSGLVLGAPRKPPLTPPAHWHLFCTLAIAGVLLLLVLLDRREPWMRTARRLAIGGAFAVLAVGVVINLAGCGGGSSTVSVVPPQTQIVTPQGTSTIVITPTATTSSGKQLAAMPPIQLTLTVK